MTRYSHDFNTEADVFAFLLSLSQDEYTSTEVSQFFMPAYLNDGKKRGLSPSQLLKEAINQVIYAYLSHFLSSLLPKAAGRFHEMGYRSSDDKLLLVQTLEPRIIERLLEDAKFLLMYKNSAINCIF